MAAGIHRASAICAGAPVCPPSPTDADYALLRSRLIRYARLLVRDRESAEDLVQDTLMAVFEQRSGWRGEAGLATWAIGILRHKAADWHRCVVRRRTIDVGGEDADGADRFDELCERCDFLWQCKSAPLEPDGALERHELARTIEKCIARLPALSGKVFVMSECMGCATAQICAELDISPQNCRTLLHRARTSLQSCLLASGCAPTAGPRCVQARRRRTPGPMACIVGSDRTESCHVHASVGD
ncbi:MAG TPA: sigma-70 family RNA polymerase sigma factor [Zeimonas sp.]|nr:sigma-70 family RNA polymerase sigma factor [Zeimonas sp.]